MTPAWPSLAEAMALPVQTATQPVRPRRPANVTDCPTCPTEIIHYAAPAPGVAPLCTTCEETTP